MEEKYKDNYRTRSARLENWDYGSHGLYYLTICTKGWVPYFGEMQPSKNNGDGPHLEFTSIGIIALNNWKAIPDFYSFVELDEYVFMPDHLHAILFINNPNKNSWAPNKFGPQTENLAAVLRGYKSSVTKDSKKNNIPFEWQPRYYDRVIRNENELQNIRNYIVNNPDNWLANNGNMENLIPM